MHKLKPLTTLITLALLTTALASTTTPANAEFKANTNNTTTGTLTFPVISTLQFGAGTVVNCVTGGASSAPSGYWTIQTSEETISANGEVQTQPATKQGPHESLTIQKWGTCFQTTGTTTLTVTFSECRLQIAQTTKGSKEQTVSRSIQTNCVISIPSIACTVTFPQTKANHGLQKTSVSNGETGVIINSEVGGQFYKAPAASCIGVSKVGNDGKLTSLGTIAKGQTLI